MKKFLKVIIPAILVLTLGLCCLTACGGDPNPKIGVYHVTEATMGDVTYRVGDEVAPGTTMTQDMMDEEMGTLEIKEDGVFVAVTGDFSQEGTWEVKDGKVVVTIETITRELTKQGDKLILEQEVAGTTARMVYEIID